MESNFRIEHDFLGEKQIPAVAYWGVHTARAVENFPISGTRVSAMPDLVRALAHVKKAAARANADVGGSQPALAYFDGEIPTPEQILAADPEELKQAGGLSRAKTQYLRSLAEHVVSGELELLKLNDLPDEEVIAELVAVKGLGVWTAQMFLMFHLGREDVMPTGDLGIRRAVMIEYGLDELPGHDELIELSEAWRPHRTLACLYLWASVDATPDA